MGDSMRPTLLSLALVASLALTSVANAQPAMTPPVAEEPIEDEISTEAHMGGVVANVFFGMGLGQAIQGRWLDTGWIFTVGTVVSMGALVSGIEGNGKLAMAGLVGFGVFYSVGIYDAVVGPSRHNARVREQRARRMGYPPVMPYVSSAQVQGTVAGVSLRF
jgi:MFS family permease